LKLKKGDKVVMHSCNEADIPENRGKIWTCKDDEFYIGLGAYRYVHLEGYKYGQNGDFLVRNLQYVDLEN
jgi:hypothetical protein